VAVFEAAKQAVEQVRSTQAPFFLELHTYRFRAHSSSTRAVSRQGRGCAVEEHGPIHTFTGG